LRTDVIRQRSRENARVRVKQRPSNNEVPSAPVSRNSSRTRSSTAQIRRHSAIEDDDDDDEDMDDASDEPGYRSIGTQRDSDSEDSDSVGTPDEGSSHILPPKYGVLKNRFKRQRISIGDSDTDSIASMGSPSLSSLAAVAAAVAAGEYYTDSPLSLSPTGTFSPRPWFQRFDL
jgi:hypothetical protein